MKEHFSQNISSKYQQKHSEVLFQLLLTVYFGVAVSKNSKTRKRVTIDPVSDTPETNMDVHTNITEDAVVKDKLRDAL